MHSQFTLEASQRLPLADAAFRLLDYILDHDFLNGVFARHRGRSYEGTISFPLFVHLITDSILGHQGSAHQTFRHAQEDQSLAASIQAVYGKLRRVPIPLSTGLFTEAAARLQEVGSFVAAHPLPASVASFRALGFDGKKLKYVVKRLKPLRGLQGNIYGGKLLIVQDLATQQAIGAEAWPDGESGDTLLVPAAVDRVRTLPADRPRLWVGDRAFCDYKLLGLLSAGRDHFVVRYNTSCGFHPDETMPPRTGQDDVERPYREEWGWLGQPKNPHRIRVRQIAITSPREDPLVFVTSLEDADRYPAIDLLSLYRSRWEIETMFQQVVQTFDLRHLIGGTPQATVFQSMLCLLLYNITLLIRDHVAVEAEREPETISLKLLFDDVVRDLAGWSKVIGTDATLELLRCTRILKPDELRRQVQERLAEAWTDRWVKAPTRRRPPKAPLRAYICGGHSSVEKILHGKHQEIPFQAEKKKPIRKKKVKDPPPFETKKKHV
jgi:hypothetical protein